MSRQRPYRVALNGYGRIGRCVLRALHERGNSASLEIVALNDLADRSPRPLADGETIDLGGKRMRWMDTPHVPHGWEAGLFYEETGSTLFCGDLLTHGGDGPALTESDVAGPAIAMEEVFHARSMAPNTGAVLHQLAGLEPTTLALMHGSSFRGDGAAALRALAAHCAGQ